MLMPGIFGESLFDDFFDFPVWDDKEERRMEKKLYGHHAKNLMKTDIRETDTEYKLEIDLPGFKKDEVQVALENGYLTISAAKGLDGEAEEKKTDPADLEKYKSIKAHVTPPMAKMMNNQCSGCFMALPLGTLRDLKSGEHMVTCDNCGRIIYIEE